MKKYISIVFISLLSLTAFSPAFAQSVGANSDNRQELIQVITQLIQELEQELQNTTSGQAQATTTQSWDQGYWQNGQGYQNNQQDGCRWGAAYSSTTGLACPPQATTTQPWATTTPSWWQDQGTSTQSWSTTTRSWWQDHGQQGTTTQSWGTTTQSWGQGWQQNGQNDQNGQNYWYRQYLYKHF